MNADFINHVVSYAPLAIVIAATVPVFLRGLKTLREFSRPAFRREYWRDAAKYAQSRPPA
jgi:hypothetical protein